MIKIVENGPHVARAALRTNHSVKLLLKGNHSRLVFLVHRDIAKHKRGIDSIVQQSHAVKCLLHHSALVNHTDHLLRLLIGVNVNHELVAPGCCLPVNSAIVVTTHIVLDLLKLGVVATAPNLLYAQFSEIVADGKQFILIEHQVTGIDLNVLLFSTSEAPLNQAYGRRSKHTYLSKTIHSALGGAQMISDDFALILACLEGKVQVSTLEHKGYLVDHVELDRETITTLQPYLHLVFVAIGKTFGTHAASLQATLAIEQHQVDDQQNNHQD